MSEAYDALYLSPHLDDAVLSCGGQIHARTARGDKVLVATLFAGDVDPASASPLVFRINERMGFGDLASAMEERRAEDRRACERLGAGFAHHGFREAPVRRPEISRLSEIFAEPSAEDAATLVALEETLRELPPAKEVLAPLGIGSHVDHLLLRRAAERAFGRLVYYEEIPYVFLKAFARARSLGWTYRRRWSPEVVPLAPDDLDAKIEAVAAYPTQVRSIFGDRQRMEKAIRRHARRVGGELLWHQL